MWERSGGYEALSKVPAEPADDKAA
jgi:hypothetical protein